MRKLLMSAGAVALLSGPAVAQDEPLDIVFTHHSSASNQFWQAVKKGMDDACDKLEARCQMVFTQTEGSIEQQAANMQAALAGEPDALLTTIVDNNAFDEIIADARDRGITVIAVNVDDAQGAEGNARQAFVGQNFTPAGYSLAQALSEQFPEDGPIHVLVGISAPGQNWSEQRGAGVMNFMEDFSAADPDRDITYERIDSGTDLAITADRVGAYLNANPNTTAYFDTGYWDAGVAQVLKDRGEEPGSVLLGGFDLVPQVLSQMQEGYIQVHVDQQPYMQGFMPVMMVYLEENFGLSPTDIDTGQGLVTPDEVDQVMALSRQGLR